MTSRRTPGRGECVLSIAQVLAGATQVADVRVVFPTLRSLFEADVVLYRWAPNSLPLAMYGALGDLTSYPTHLIQGDPVVSYLRRVPPGPRVVPLTRLVGREAMRSSVAYDLVYRPNRVDEMISANFTNYPFLSGFLALGLGRPHAFTPDDEQSLQMLLPFFGAVERRARRLERLEVRAASLSRVVEQRSAHPLIIAGLDGSILWQSESAKRLLRLAAGTDAKLPSEIDDAVRRYERSGGGNLPVDCGCITGAGRTIAFDLHPLVPRGELGPLLVELMPDAEKPLTPAERRVLGLLRQGRSLAEVARALGVSLETVRTHTRSIYRKHGVASRAELFAARSF